jgi:hypothetical protein
MKSVHKSNMSPKPSLVKVDIPHKDNLLSFMHEFIVKVIYVKGDDHCVFRTIAILHDMYVDDYRTICYQHLKELIDDDSELYRRLIGTEK